MAAVSSAPAGATALTPPTSSHGDDLWDFPGGASEKTRQDDNSAPRFEQVLRSPLGSQNGNAMSSSYGQSNNMEFGARKMHSADNLNAARWGKPGDGSGALSPSLPVEPRLGHGSSSDWALHSKQHPTDERKRHIQQTLGLEYSEESSKWIHRDKLAKIESQELQAAGFIIPRVRASSKQRRHRGQQSIDHGQSRPRNDAAAATIAQREETPSSPCWDLRTPEEIAEEIENAYFTPQGVKGGTRIPVAKISPAPIPQDFLERGSPAIRRIDSAEGDTIAYPKTRSRSASASTKELETANNNSRMVNAKRPVTDTSPRKNTPRKSSTASKSSTITGRPKTRSGSNKEGSGTRPVTRSGESFAAGHQPEGDPLWVFDSYKPDPRLPPDQQLLPTVAKRLRQEQWEKEGKFGDAYDREFRPLNDHDFPQPQEREHVAEEEENPQQVGDWPLKPGLTKSPKQSSYSTMPKISDKPLVSPVTSPKTPIPPPISQSQDIEPIVHAEQDGEKKKKAGCGCCVIM
ncbi:hypothetical protein QQS21_010714 [Conoideocrella luteorostrata]|uniref:TeaA receptor TeaR n=1 Tax=Conoideocrella luteorostrata TaxID=1105319 RepID=A0AAJ0CEM5_9HYPO|nr:hypothetical protein QQS21_010714 [Conoideocrella luteorostrata]